MERIVVGIDDSENARKALEWAMEEARVRGASVEAVMAWHEPYEAGATIVPLVVDPADFEGAHRERLSEVLEATGATTSDVDVTAKLVRGAAARVLLDEAAEADLLVVGCRGRGGFLGLLMGSVSQQVVWHAPCPVVVIPKPEADVASGSAG